MNRPILVALLVLTSGLMVLSGRTMAEGPGDAELARKLTDLGITAQMQSEHSAALAYFERARREVDHPKIRYFHAKSLDAVGRHDDALTAFRALAGDKDMLKYAGEVQAYIRAIVAEAEKERLTLVVSDLRRACPAATPGGQGATPGPSTKESSR